MTLNYALTNADFLEYQLYASSKSELHKKNRFRSRIIVAIIYILMGLYFANKNENIGVAIIMSGIGICWFAFHPMYSKWKYRRHFKKHVEENYKNRIGKPVEIDFNGQSLNTKDVSSVSSINGSELKELIEIKNYFFIKLKMDISIVVPKHAIPNEAEFKQRVINLGAEYVDELNWTWK